MNAKAAPAPEPRSVKELKGMFGKPTRRVSIREMNRAIACQGASANRG